MDTRGGNLSHAWCKISPSIMFIVIEGIDATGKTTLSKSLAEKLGVKYYKSPPKLITSFRKMADRSSPQIRYLYYSLGNLITTLALKTLYRNKIIICEWYAFSTSAYHSVLLGKDLNLPKIIILPNLVIFLTCNMEEIKERLLLRKETNKYEQLSFLEKVRKQYPRLFKLYNNIPVLTYDTGIKSSEQTSQNMVTDVQNFVDKHTIPSVKCKHEHESNSSGKYRI